MSEFARTIWPKALAAFLLAAIVAFGVERYRAQTSVAPANPIEIEAPAATVLLTPEGPKPDRVTVSVGQIVEFAARDGKLHDIREGAYVATHDSHAAAPKYSSGVFTPDEAYRVRLDTPGVFMFHDHLVPELIIHVIVNGITTS